MYVYSYIPRFTLEYADGKMFRRLTRRINNASPISCLCNRISHIASSIFIILLINEICNFSIFFRRRINSMKLRVSLVIGFQILLIASVAEPVENKQEPCYDQFNRCNGTAQDGPEVKVQFSTRIVKNEYIVAFKGYYKPLTRKSYIGAALNSSGVKSWRILSRDNPASGFPSDFDVVLLKETDRRNGLSALSDHPLVRRVTPQRVVHRTLKYINNTEDGDMPEYKNFKRKINGYVGIIRN